MESTFILVDDYYKSIIQFLGEISIVQNVKQIQCHFLHKGKVKERETIQLPLTSILVLVAFLVS